MKIEQHEEGHAFVVHYKGWKNKCPRLIGLALNARRWDECVSSTNLVKLDEAGRALQEELRLLHSAVPLAEAMDEAAAQPKLEAAANAKTGKLTLPPELVELLGKDWDLVNRHHYLLVLPSTVTANDVIAEFRKVYRKKKLVGLGVFDQFTTGLKRALDGSIGRGLLYRFERQQLRDVTEKNKRTELSEMYGPVVLVRYLGTAGACTIRRFNG